MLTIILYIQFHIQGRLLVTEILLHIYSGHITTNSYQTHAWIVFASQVVSISLVQDNKHIFARFIHPILMGTYLEMTAMLAC